MKTITFTVATLVLALGVVTGAMAQQGGPRDQQGGQHHGNGEPGGQQGHPGMGMRRGPGGPAEILRDPKVQQHLKLTQNQMNLLNEVLGQPVGGPAYGGQGRGNAQGGFGGGQQGGNGAQSGPGGPSGQGGYEERQKQIDAKIKAILDEGQYKRFRELTLQKQGPVAVMQPDVSQKLNFTQEQREQVMQIMRENAPPMGRQGGPGGPSPEGGLGGRYQGGQGQGQRGNAQGDQQGYQGRQGEQRRQSGQGRQIDPEQMKARIEELNKKILAIFTQDQRKTWNSMLGAKFTFSEPQRGRQGTPPPQG